jgi:hypothetical protein
MKSAYILFFLALVFFIVSSRVTRRLGATADKRILGIIARNLAEVLLILTVVSGAYFAASLALMWFVSRDDITIIELKHFDDFLRHSRMLLKEVEIKTWWFVVLLLVLAPFSFLPIRQIELAGTPLLRWFVRFASPVCNILRRCRTLHKRLGITLTFALSFTFLPSMNAGDIERITSARLQKAGKQLAEIDDFYRQTTAADVAREVVNRSITVMPPDYIASITKFPEGARQLDEEIKSVEAYYRVSLTDLHQEVAPLIGRFKLPGGGVSTERPEPREDTSERLLGEILASSVGVTFSDIERVSAAAPMFRVDQDSRRDEEKEDLPGQNTTIASSVRADALPREIVEKTASELLATRRFADPVSVRLGFSSMIEEYPWLEPLFDVVSDTIGKFVAGRPFDVAWRPLARLFEREGEFKDDPIVGPIRSRSAELSNLLAPDVNSIGAHGRVMLAVVTADGLALGRISTQLEEARSQANRTLIAQRLAITALQREISGDVFGLHPLPPGPGFLRDGIIDHPGTPRFLDHGFRTPMRGR